MYYYRALETDFCCDEEIPYLRVSPKCRTSCIKIQFLHDKAGSEATQVDEIFITDDESRIFTPGLGVLRLRHESIELKHLRHCSSLEKTFLILEYILPTFLSLQGCIALHASAIVEDGIGKCFIGPSMCGKSTRVALGALQGHQVLAQDVAVLRYNSHRGAVEILPGSGLIALRYESAKYIRCFLPPVDVFEGKDLFLAEQGNVTVLSELYFLEEKAGQTKSVAPAVFFQLIMQQMFLQKYHSQSKPEGFMRLLNRVFSSSIIRFANHNNSYDPATY